MILKCFQASLTSFPVHRLIEVCVDRVFSSMLLRGNPNKGYVGIERCMSFHTLYPYQNM